nr:hypothetical protein [Tanacetum cinerariifolium]
MGAPPSPDYIPGPEAPPSPDYIPGPEAPPSPDYIPGPEYPEYLPPADDMLQAEEQPLPVAVSPTAESPGYFTESEPEMEPEENDGDDEKSEGDSIDYPTSEEDNDGDDDGDDLLEDDADNEDEEESSDSEEEEEEHLALTIPALAPYSSVSKSDETEPFEEGETAATPPPFGYRIAAKISVQPHILMPFRSESEIDRLLAIPTPPLSPVSLTSYTLPPLLTPFPIYTPLPTSSFLVPSSIPSSSGSESIPEADIPLQKRARFTTPTSRYEIGESSVAAATRPMLTITESRRADVMSSDSHATVTYTSMSSYEVTINENYGMPMHPLDPYVQLVMGAPPSPDYIPRPEAPASPDYIPGPEYLEYLPLADDMLPAEEQPLPAAVSPTA